jgi:hypothetical protein
MPQLTPMEVTANNLAYNEANNPFLHAKRFEIQIHRGNDRQNHYLPRWEIVEMVLGTKAFSAADPKRPDMVLVCDNRDTCIQVLRWEKSWYGYATTLRRGAALGEEPRFVCSLCLGRGEVPTANPPGEGTTYVPCICRKADSTR